LKGSFYRLLKERGQKWTRQRDEIAKEFLKAGRQAGRHLSVLELYQRVRDRNPRIGYATVYRTLKLVEKTAGPRPGNLGNAERGSNSKRGKNTMTI